MKVLKNKKGFYKQRGKLEKSERITELIQDEDRGS